MRAHDLRHKQLISGLVEDDDSVRHEVAQMPVVAVT